MKIIKSEIRDILNSMNILPKPIDEVRDNDNLLDYGLRSINIVLFIKLLEQKFAFEFVDDDMVLNNFKNINMIEKLVKKYTE